MNHMKIIMNVDIIIRKEKKQVYSIDNANLEKEDAKVRRQEKIKVRKRKLEDLKNCQIIENHAKKNNA